MISRIINIKECFCESLTVKVILKYSNISSEGKKEGKTLKIAVHFGPLCLFDTLNFPGFTRNLATVFEFKARPKRETQCFLLDDKTCAGVSWLYLYRHEENHKDRWGNWPRRSRFSHIIHFYFLWIIVTGFGHQLRFIASAFQFHRFRFNIFVQRLLRIEVIEERFPFEYIYRLVIKNVFMRYKITKNRNLRLPPSSFTQKNNI